MAADEVHTGWGLTAHRDWMKQRWKAFVSLFGPWSGQAIHGWPHVVRGRSQRLCRRMARTVPDRTRRELPPSGFARRRAQPPMRAGDFSPTQTWTFEEAAASEHALISSLPQGEAGQLVGVALDGDGDRCLFVESTPDGFAIVDGDAMAAMLLEQGGTTHGDLRPASNRMLRCSAMSNP